MTSTQAIKEIANTFQISPIYARRIYGEVKKTSNFLKEAGIIISKKPKPFVKWVGGKRQLLKQFKEIGLYPPDEFDPTINSYFEPFVGGGAVFFDLLPKKAYLSDLNNELIITYNIIKNDVEKLIQSLKKHKYTKDYFLKIRARKVSSLSLLEIASRFIYLNKTAYNGMYRVNTKGEFNVPFGRFTNPLICDEENLRKVAIALQDVEINHQDYKEVVKKAKKGDFIYFDPPYDPISKTSSFTSYTKEAFSKKDQIELRNMFLELHEKGCFLMLSNSDSDFINMIYSEISKHGIKINKVKAGRTINAGKTKRGKIVEVLITNY